MFIIAMAAITVDGKIARDKAHYVDWTSPEDKKLFVQTTKKHFVTIMGLNTYRTLKNPVFKDRLMVVFSPDYFAAPRLIRALGDPTEAIAMLEEMGYKSAVLIGGAELNSAFLQKKLINEIWLTIEPKLFGQGLSLFSETIDDKSVELSLMDMLLINDDSIFLKYAVSYL